MLRVLNVSKRFRGGNVLEGINLTLGKERLAIVGIHNAGKSVLLNIMAGICKPTQGKVITDEGELRKTVAYIPQVPLFDPLLTVKDIANYVDALPYLDQVELDRNKRVKDLTLGERKRLSLAISLPFYPSFLLVDEMDQENVDFFSRFISKFNGGVILAHYNTKITNLCEKVMILSHGRITYSGGKDGLKYKVIRTNQNIVKRFPDLYVTMAGEIGEVWERNDQRKVEDALDMEGVKYEVIQVEEDEVFLRFYA
ncbi:ATP-binding cassette domain-containing protein [Sulfolobus metallicus DSM 6482 = JCM 9184]|uniref:ATP-binding cassette domain-containing protein n=1 Tax=Sulfuracidifex metallicus DSM 6482 = JCM 9184 TaxID=523847 RepID=A0A6A9QQ41_SULME|nr:ATP-binding cassette domain-containing protein [Sulfuracidifex metallicus DSM 6482 = JCM 9184]